MPKHVLPIIAIIETLENTGCYVEALGFPEVLRFHFDEAKALESLTANSRKLAEETALASLHQRHPAGAAELDEVVITVEPPAGQKLWRRPVALKFPLIRWRHGDAALLAYVPAFCITVIATKPATREALDKLVLRNIRATLLRRDLAGSLNDLMWLQRGREIKLVTSEAEVSLPTYEPASCPLCRAGQPVVKPGSRA